MSLGKITQAIRQYILDHYDSPVTDRRGRVDPIEEASFLREEQLECLDGDYSDCPVPGGNSTREWYRWR